MKRLALLLIAFLAVARSLIVLNKYTIDCNPAIVSIALNVDSSKVKDPSMNLTVNVFSPIKSITVFTNISLPENDRDENFKKLMLMNKCDFVSFGTNMINKVAQGRSGKFAVKYPIQKGTYKLMNLTLLGNLLQPNPPSKIHISVRFEGVAGTSKSGEVICSTEATIFKEQD